jgi:hypothetical protein
MPKDVKVPLLGNVPKPALFAGVIGAGVVTVYLIYKHKENAAAPLAGASGYGYATGAEAGYGQGYYSYGSEFAYGGSMGGGVSPYPVASEYGYGAFGYGYYNPYTGQYLGGGTGTGVVTPTPTPTGSGTGGTSGTGKPGTHTITANGKLDLYYTAKMNGITEGKLIRLNPQLSHLVGGKKPIPKGTRVKV